MRLHLAVIPALALFAAPGCASKEPDAGRPYEPPGDNCFAIVHACHYVDLGPGEIHDCHTIGHEGPEFECAEEANRCVALCVAAQPDASPDAPAPMTSPDASPDAAPPPVDAGAIEAGGSPPDASPADASDEDAPHTTPTPSRLCFDLSNICHQVDPGSGPLHECHEIGHDGVHELCVENWDRCNELCMQAM